MKTIVALALLFAVSYASEPSICEEGWTYFCNPTECYCYHFLNQSVSWTQAHSECKFRSANLVSWHSMEERNFVYYTASSVGVYSFWTGLNELESENVKKWSDGTPLDYDDSFTYSGNFTDCYFIFRKTAMCSWGDCFNHRDDTCWGSMPFVCKKPSIKRNICDGAHRYFCTPTRCSCYYYSGYDANIGRQTFQNALISCASMGGYLASIHSDEEAKFFNALVRGVDYVWTGLTDRNLDGEFEWEDKSNVEFLNWATNEPSSVAENRNCVVSRRDSNTGANSKWHVEDCNTVNHYVCKRDKNLA